MLKIAALSGALAIGLISGAYAQNTGPAAQTDNMNKPGMTNSNHPFGSTSENFPRTWSSTFRLARTTIGKVSRRLNGLQASMTTRALRGSSVP